MKQILKNKIINIKNTDKFDNKLLFYYLDINYKNNKIKVYFMWELLEKKKNLEILEKTKQKPAMYSNVYSPKDELEIFKWLFDNAIKNKNKIHIIWITLKEEIKILEKYYLELWFMREDINCFDVDFKIPLVTVSINIKNIMWKWSDYKKQAENIFFNPPIRESGQVKAMFKWINRWVIAWIYIQDFNKKIKQFIENQINSEKILITNISKILYFNLEEIWFTGIKKELIINY